MKNRVCFGRIILNTHKNVWSSNMCSLGVVCVRTDTYIQTDRQTDRGASTINNIDTDYPSIYRPPGLGQVKYLYLSTWYKVLKLST